MKKFFTILGGMGTIASEHFVYRLNRQTNASCDQEYLNYLLVNHATIPDRTAYLLDQTKQNPLFDLKEDILQFSQLNPQFFVLTCNTAHVFYDTLQSLTPIPILHMPKSAVAAVKKKKNPLNSKRVMVLATQGTLNQEIYKYIIEENQLDYLIPKPAIQRKLNVLIYEYIKQKNDLNFKLFEEILFEIHHELPDCTIILGCTELSYIYDHSLYKKSYIVDAQAELIKEVIFRAQY